MKLSSSESGDMIKIDGLKYKGFGILPKSVMLDSHISIEAKTIFAYFCSLAGNKESAFPKRDTILKQLNISKDYYYKNFNQLIENGHVVVEKIGQFPFKNVYILKGKKTEDVSDSTSDDSNGKLYSSGFGIVPRDLMLNSAIPIKSKGIFAYLCALSGSNASAFPKVESILLDLGIGKQTYHKFFKVLIEYNYITVKQRKINGRFSINDYVIKNELDRQKINNYKKAEPEDSIKLSSRYKIQDNEVGDTAQKDTNINTPVIKNNFFEYNLSANLNAICLEQETPLMDLQNIDFEKLTNPNTLEICEYIKDLILFVEKTKSKTLKINGELVSVGLVRSNFSKLKTKHIDQVINGIMSTQKEIKNKRSYTLTALYNSVSLVDFGNNITHKKDNNAKLIQRETQYTEEELEQILLNKQKRTS